MDYRDFERGSEREEHQSDCGFWWREGTPEARATALMAASKQMVDEATERSQANLVHARLYGNAEAMSFKVRGYHKHASDPVNRISENIIASCIDTLGAKIAKTKPRPAFMTEGGNYSQQQAAKRLDKFWRGIFHECKIYELTPRIFFDGCIFDIGALKAFIDPATKRLKFERVFPDDLFVDPVDGMYGEPKQLMQRQLVPRETLEFLYKDDKEKLLKIRECKCPEDANRRGFGDCLEVWEAWHLESAPGAGDGKRMLGIDGCELEFEDWKLKRFPFAFFRFSHRQLGFFGQGLAERLTGIQREITRLLRSISEQLRRRGRGRVFVAKGSKVNPAHLTNAIGDIVEFNGQPPIVDNANAVAGEEFGQLDRLREHAYQEAGISELSAGAKKPSGLDAAVAIREFNDVETERFALVGRAWEVLHMDLTELGIDLLEAAGIRSYKVKVPGFRAVEYLDLKDIKLSRDAFIVQMFPVSSLPQTPSHRYQRVKEMEQDGYIDKPTAQRLLDLPDIEAEENLAMAARDDVDHTIAKILDLDTPEYVPPDEFTDLALLVQRATAAYLRAKHLEGVGEERLEMLIQLIDQAKSLLMPPAPSMPAAMPGEEMGAAPPMPVSGMPPAPPPMVQGDLNVNAAPAPAPAIPPLMAP